MRVGFFGTCKSAMHGEGATSFYECGVRCRVFTTGAGVFVLK